MPTEFPGTSFSCISIFPNRYSFLDWKPEPEALSRERVRSCPLLRILALPSPQVISKSWYKLPTEATTKEPSRRDTKSNFGERFEVEGEAIECEYRYEKWGEVWSVEVRRMVWVRGVL